MNSFINILYRQKRWAATFLVACLLLALIPTESNAAGPASPLPLKAELVGATGWGGNTVSVSVYMEPGNTNSGTSSDDAFFAYDLTLSYDLDTLTLDSVEDEAGAQDFTPDTDTDGTVRIAGGDFSGFGFFMERQKLFTLNFKVNPSARPGDTEIAFTNGRFLNMDMYIDMDQVNLLAGKVAIENEAPTANTVEIGGTLDVGQTLTGKYTYADLERNEEAGTMFKWYAASDAAGTERTVVGTERTLKLTSGMAGQYLFFEVTPMAKDGQEIGQPTLSPSVGPVAAQAAAAVTIGTANAKQGDIVEIPVILSTSPVGVGSFGIELAFDASALEVTGITGPGKDSFSSHYDNKNGWLRTAWADNEAGDNPITAGQRLFTVSFKVKASSETGLKTLTIADQTDLRQFSLTDIMAIELMKTLTSGSITIMSSSGISGGTVTEPSNKAVVLVNGREERIGTITSTKQDGQSVTKVEVDQTKLLEKLEAAGDHAVITIPIYTGTDKLIGELTGEMLKQLASKKAVLVIDTGDASYTLPTEQIRIAALAEQLGQPNGLADIRVQVEIAKASADMVKRVEAEAARDSFTLITSPMEFSIKASYGEQTIEATQFDSYVERTIAIPEGVEASKITTGVVVDPNGTVRHVPTRIMTRDGKYYAQINSLTNSAYSVIWHPYEFTDMAGHWAKDAVNDMASRLVVKGVDGIQFNPDQDITRAEFAAIIVRGLGLKETNKTTPYSDVKAEAWYNSAVYTAQQYGLINGFEDGSFRPDEKITREQTMTILSRAMQITGLKGKQAKASVDTVLSAYTDAGALSKWAYSSAVDCLQGGIVTGRTSYELAPQANITRAEVATMVQRLLQKSDLI